MEMTKELSVDNFPEFCRKNGLKCTAQRLAVFSVVHALATHPSVDEVWLQVKRTVPTVTRDSIYRILNEFAALGLLKRLDSLSFARYDTWLKPHAHFICEKCGDVIDYPLPEALPVPMDMPHNRHHLELRITGVCNRCAEDGNICDQD